MGFEQRLSAADAAVGPGLVVSVVLARIRRLSSLALRHGVLFRREQLSVEQIVAVLKQAEMGMPVGDLTRQLGISEQTFYRWKKQQGTLGSLNFGS